jgi:hypothetical protein
VSLTSTTSDDAYRMFWNDSHRWRWARLTAHSVKTSKRQNLPFVWRAPVPSDVEPLYSLLLFSLGTAVKEFYARCQLIPCADLAQNRLPIQTPVRPSYDRCWREFCL